MICSDLYLGPTWAYTQVQALAQPVDRSERRATRGNADAHRAGQLELRFSLLLTLGLGVRLDPLFFKLTGLRTRMLTFLSPDSSSGLDMQTNMLGIAPSRAHRSPARRRSPPSYYVAKEIIVLIDGICSVSNGNWVPKRWNRSWRPSTIGTYSETFRTRRFLLFPSSRPLLFGVSLGSLALTPVLSNNITSQVARWRTTRIVRHFFCPERANVRPSPHSSLRTQ